MIDNSTIMESFQRELEAMSSQSNGTTIPDSLLKTWLTLPASIRSSLISHDHGSNSNAGMLPSLDNTSQDTTHSSSSSTYSETINTMRKLSQPHLADNNTQVSASSSVTYELDSDTMMNHSVQSSSYSTSNNSNSQHNNNNHGDTQHPTMQSLDEYGTALILSPLERAPHNVYAFTKTHTDQYTKVTKTPAATVTTTTHVLTTSHGWRNVFHLPISYDITVLPYGTLFDPTNPQLLHSTGIQPEGYNRRFAVIDAQVDAIYGETIRYYFTSKGIDLTVCTLQGGEQDKRPAAVHTLLDQLCVYKLRRREPFLAIGGGVLLDIAGMAACLYRRGVPFVRVPTTLLAIVDASVGVKNGVDYCCSVTDETYKNRIGSFYAPSACLLDKAFIATQDSRNVSNGFGEILKLALVRSIDLFELLEAHGQALIESKLTPTCTVQDGISDRIIDLSIQIMLEELGPNLWETKLDRCVDYGHTFSKLLEMVPGIDIMHGEAVNVDGFFCVVLSYLRGYIDLITVQRISLCMKSLSLPTFSPYLTAELAWQSCKDAIEHRNGEQRIPLITEIGDYVCVSDITPEEISRGLVALQDML